MLVCSKVVSIGLELPGLRHKRHSHICLNSSVKAIIKGTLWTQNFSLSSLCADQCQSMRQLSQLSKVRVVMQRGVSNLSNGPIEGGGR